jgi:hypothetical protein
VSAVCFQVEVSATSWSLVQRSPTDCGASLFVYDLKSSKTGRPWSSLDRSAKKKKKKKNLGINANYFPRGNNRSHIYSYWRSKSGLYPVPVCARFVAGKIALWQALLRVNLVIIPPVLNAHLRLIAALRWTRRRNLEAF